MKTLLRIVGFAVIVLLGLFALAAAYLAFVFDPNDYRERIAAEVEQRTGRSLAIEGDIGLSLFPWLGIELSQVRLGNAEGFGEQPFATVGEVQLRARLMPLLRSELEVDRVVLRRLALDLQRDADGRTNWDDLIAAGDERIAEAPPPEETDTEAATRALAAFVISGVEIDSARVSWDDRQEGVRHVFSELSLESGEIRAGSRFPLELAFDFALSEPAIQGRFACSSNVLLDPDAARAELTDFALQLDVRGDDIPGGAQRLSMQAGLDLDLAESRVRVAELGLRAAGLEASGELRGGWQGETPGVAGSLEVARFDPRELIQALGYAVPEVADESVLRRAGLGTRFELSGTSVHLHRLRLELDDSVLDGEFGITDFSRQAIRFDLALDAIDLDRYLPPREERTAVTPGAVALGIDPEMLRDRDIAGRLSIGELRLGGVVLSDVEFEVRGEADVLALTPLSASLYGGRYDGNVRLDGRREALSISLDESLTGVEIGPLLRDLTGEEPRLTGRADVQASLQARGNDGDAIKQSLSGDARFRFVDGAVRGINVAQYLREARARIRGEPVPEMREPNRTDFSQMTGTLRIADGVVRNNDLDVRSPLLRVSGNGSANLVSERIDYLVRASVVATLEGQGGAGLADLRGLTVPIRVGGTFDAPRYALDVEGLLAESLRERARDELEQRLREQAPEELREQLQRGLGDLFRR